MKELSIVITAFGSDKSLEACLSSMCGTDDRLEILAVYDPAQDWIRDILNSFEQNSSSRVRIIRIESKTAGAGIPEALASATGRYVKVIGAEDKVCTEHLQGVLDEIGKTDVDVILIGYTMEDPVTGHSKSYIPVSNSSGRQIDIIKLNDKYEDVRQFLDSRSLCFRTSFLREFSNRLDKPVVCDDLEFSTLPFIDAESFLILPDQLQVCSEKKGSLSEFMEEENGFTEKIQTSVRNTLEYYLSRRPMGKARDDFMHKRLFKAVENLYGALLILSADKKKGRKQAEAFRTYLSEKDAVLAKATERKYRILKRSGRFTNAQKYYEKRKAFRL